MTEQHPSLKLNPELTGKSASEILKALNLEVSSIKESIARLKEQSSTIEGDFNSLDALQVLASIENKVSAFVQRYDAVLSKAEANLDLEREALASLKGLAGKV